MKAIIVEDNPNAAQVIETVLSENELDVEVCGIAESVEDAVVLIQKFRPSLWLLDIRLKDELVFALFNKIDASLTDQAAVIFITAYHSSDYLHKAIKSSAFDYIYKPIDEFELVAAVQRAKSKIEEKDLYSRIKQLEKKVSELSQNSANKIPIYRVHGKIDYLETEKIMYLEADQSICRFWLTDGSSIPSVKHLGFYKDGILKGTDFIQISKKHIVNNLHVQTFYSIAGKILLKNNVKLEVSRRKGRELKEHFKNILK